MWRLQYLRSVVLKRVKERRSENAEEQFVVASKEAFRRAQIVEHDGLESHYVVCDEDRPIARESCAFAAQRTLHVCMRDVPMAAVVAPGKLDDHLQGDSCMALDSGDGVTWVYRHAMLRAAVAVHLIVAYRWFPSALPMAVVSFAVLLRLTR